MWQQGYSNFVCGVQHDSCPLGVREALARVQPSEVSDYLKDVGICESMVLSTCNRFEVYGWGKTDKLAGQTASDDLTHRLAYLSGVEPETLRAHTYHKDQRNMIRHGFGVAASMHSMVVGEPQILGQMKTAWQNSQATGHTGPFMDRFAGAALRVGKRARSETSIGKAPVSVATVAVRLAEDIYGQLEGLNVLLVGAGEMTQNAAQHLQSSGVQEIMITNRSYDKAKAVAAKFNANVAPFAELPHLLTRADVVLMSTGSDAYLVNKTMVKQALKARKQAPMLFVDMAIPRDVDPDAHKLENCYVYDMDSLAKLANKAIEKRQGAVMDVMHIIDEETNRFMDWLQSRQQAALIHYMRSHFHQVRQEVLEKHGQDCEKATRLLVNKLLHQPSQNLRNHTFTNEQIKAFNRLLFAETTK